MTERVTSEFKVDEIIPGQGDIWLEDRQEGRKGLLVAVEMDVDYDDELWSDIQSLNEGDLIEAELESQNSLNTVWHFTDVAVKREAMQRVDRSGASA